MKFYDCTTEINRNTNNEFGREGENIASSFLEKKGFEIINRNYRYQRMGEIDIIIKKGNLIIFVEVKNRKRPFYGGAHYSISGRKRKTLKKIASHFLASHPVYYTRDIICRFDMISVNNDGIEWIKDIFR